MRAVFQNLIQYVVILPQSPKKCHFYLIENFL